MKDTVISVEHLTKRYRLFLQEDQPETLREVLLYAARSPFHYLRQMSRPPTEEETLWALRDVSFAVKRGEVVGIIGRNGAGKSTLLKILSRITDPSDGRAVIHGRIGSLLEVGTGFHPELTGRENIYLSGTILGMTRQEIERKFDEIVAFSGIERFIDTPVKRYSSGMHVRLGFAVAAHLEPEILIVDEVLAVGDAGFQRKCLGKMESIAGEGRTVLFVSHSMPTIQALCQRAIVLEQGEVVLDGSTEAAIEYYLRSQWSAETSSQDLTNHPNRATPAEDAVFTRLRLLNSAGEESLSFDMGEPIHFEISLDTGETVLNDPLLTVMIEKRGARVCNLPTHYMVTEPMNFAGPVLARCEWEPPLLTPGDYTVASLIIKKYSGADRLDMIKDVATFEIRGRDVHGTGKIAPEGTLIVPTGRWEFQSVNGH